MLESNFLTKLHSLIPSLQIWGGDGVFKKLNYEGEGVKIFQYYWVGKA